MNISEENCMKLIVEKFPEFQSNWNSYKAENEDASLWGEMGEFSSYVSQLLIDEKTKSSQIKDIFSYMEQLLNHGNDKVQNAVMTCFLENILNITPSQINPHRYIPFLGQKSRKFCQEWDKFTGVQTEGL